VTDDPERLVAEALRAHAARTPLPNGPHTGPITGATNGTGLGGYGLLSGADVALPNPAPAHPSTVQDPALSGETSRIRSGGGIAVGWVLVLALLLGLAAGAVVGLVTLL
jgi:hypothetical protein